MELVAKRREAFATLADKADALVVTRNALALARGEHGACHAATFKAFRANATAGREYLVAMRTYRKASAAVRRESLKVERKRLDSSFRV